METSDPSDCKNPVITLDLMGHDLSDWMVQNKYFLVFRSIGSLVSLIQVSKQIDL